MEINTVIIDTNAYAEFMRGNKIAIEVIQKVKNIIITPILTGELLSGFLLGSKENENKSDLKKFLDSKRVITLNIDTRTSEYFAKIYKILRKNGTPIPTNDMWIAAIAMQYDFAIFSFDKHFINLSGIKLIRDINDLT